VTRQAAKQNLMGKSKGPRNQNRNKIAVPKNEPALCSEIHAPLQPPRRLAAARNAVRYIWGAIEKLAVILSFVGVAYLVYDSLYQTNLTMSFVYSDAATALDNSIAIQNRSNLFSVRNIQWSCYADHLQFEQNITINKMNLAFETISAIEPGEILNVACNTTRRVSVFGFEGQKLLSGGIVLSLSYDADIFGLWTYHRKVTTPFLWIGNIAQGQWVPGNFAR
jgi:hypothetical protein